MSVADELTFRSVVTGANRHGWMITQLENRFWGFHLGVTNFHPSQPLAKMSSTSNSLLGQCLHSSGLRPSRGRRNMEDGTQDTFLLGYVCRLQGLRCPPVGDCCLRLSKSRRKPQSALPFLMPPSPQGLLSPPLERMRQEKKY